MIWQPSNGAALKHSMPTYPQIQPLDVGITGPGDGANIDAEMKQIQIMRRQIAFPLLLLVSGCTTQAWYEGFAHFSDRGRLFQADRGRRFSAIVDAQGMRASEGLNVSQVDFDDADLSTAEGGACDEPTAAVGKSCWH
jgi:hypothetical protein